MSIFFSRHLYNVIGIDNEPSIVSKAVERNRRLEGGAKFMCVNALDIPNHFEENAFDVAFSQGFLEHFDDTEIKNLISSQLKVARNVVFSVPSIHWPSTDLGDERKMTLEQWKTILMNLGFLPDHISYYQKGDLHIAVVIRRDELQ
jgi:2-polyprenyl-3-methyl-5-hydroxy-6-metoxy-1,4-benzoquinol methylase